VSITIGISGSIALSREVHSMPDIRGRNTSISTTSGFSTGIMRRASSADAQVQTQVKSGNEEIRRLQLSRVSRWSSTRATRVGAWGAAATGSWGAASFMMK
jgi:hypothetical protein